MQLSEQSKVNPSYMENPPYGISGVGPNVTLIKVSIYRKKERNALKGS